MKNSRRKGAEKEARGRGGNVTSSERTDDCTQTQMDEEQEMMNRSGSHEKVPGYLLSHSAQYPVPNRR